MQSTSSCISESCFHWGAETSVLDLRVQLYSVPTGPEGSNSWIKESRGCLHKHSATAYWGQVRTVVSVDLSCWVCACVLSRFSCVRLCLAPQNVAHQDPLSMGFFRQEYWRGLSCLPPGGLPHPGIEPTSLTSPALAGRFFTTRATWEAILSLWISLIELPTCLEFKRAANTRRLSTTGANLLRGSQEVYVEGWVSFISAACRTWTRALASLCSGIFIC